MFSARYAKIQQVEEKNSKREDIGFSGKMTPRFQLTKAQRLLLLIGVLALSAAVCPPSYAQFNSNAGSIVLRATMAEAFSVTVTGAGPSISHWRPMRPPIPEAPPPQFKPPGPCGPAARASPFGPGSPMATLP